MFYAPAAQATLRSAGASAAEALNGGYQLAFLLGAGCGLAAAVLGVWLKPAAKTSASTTATAH